MGRAAVVLSFMALGAGCAGSEDQGNVLQTQSCKGSFGQADACGGSLEGNWTYVSACAGQEILAPILAVCRDASLGEIAVDVTSGGLAIQSSTYNLNLTADVTLTARIPAGCATLAGGCSSLQAWAQGLLPGSSATCTGDSACECQVSLAIGAASRGKLSAKGNVVTLSTGQYYYCVEGNVARYRGVPGKAGGDQAITYVMVRR